MKVHLDIEKATDFAMAPNNKYHNLLGLINCNMMVAPEASVLATALMKLSISTRIYPRYSNNSSKRISIYGNTKH
jgi:hypothetical protein